MWSAFFLSFGIIFGAELGDKSQLMAMAFAARYKALPVLLGISIATAVTHAWSVGLGSVVGDQMPTASISIVAGVAFLGFAGWTLRGDTLSEDEAQAAQKNTRNAVPHLRNPVDSAGHISTYQNRISRVNLQRLGVPASLDLQVPCAM